MTVPTCARAVAGGPPGPPGAVPGHRGAREEEVGVASIDAHLVVRQADERFPRHLGGTSAEVCGRPLLHLVHPTARGRLARRLARLLNGTDHRFTERIPTARRPAGGPTVTLTGYAVRGGPLGVTAILVASGPPPAAVPEAAGPGGACLTPVDARILEGIAAGHSTLSLASRLHFSRQNIDYRVTGLLRRFQVPNRTALVSRAFSTGLLAAGTWPPRVAEGRVR
ncbi:PAS domain-containing protein [Streptomyces pactum]|uniref:PAS domain-containing protein n=1 Tax=Streptomyces pactum TaxID=68249 RepID=A0ABS0NSM6_9ACTN|nr:PAS domain-containing protein [Streptomyces pactum]MBH5338029.1 PAS domain-containing protein [Streptomyces pactum]